MDNLTHALVGAALARAGLERRTPLATATLVIAANAPDVDVLAYARGEWFALSFRRGITHGVPALVVLPFAVAGALLAWDRWVRRRRDPDRPPAPFRELLLLALIGVLTHPVLDWMNTYGMRWWLPFDGRWSYGDSLFIIDPWLWLLLGTAVALGGARERTLAALWALLAAVASAAVLGTPLVPGAAKVLWGAGVAAAALVWVLGRPATGRARTVLAQALGGAALLYVAAMVVTHRAAADDVRSAMAEGLPGREEARVMIAPLPALPFRSEVIVATPGGYVPGTQDWRATPAFELAFDAALPALSAAGDVSEADAIGAVAAARLHPDVAHYLVWSRFPYWHVERAQPGFRVSVGDARYTDRAGGLSGLTVTVGAPRAGR